MIYKGDAVSGGYAVGEVFVFKPFRAHIEPKYLLQNQVGEALRRFRTALHEADKELASIIVSLPQDKEDESRIFEAHRSILSDEDLLAEIEEKIGEDLLSPEYAVELCFERFIQLLSANESATFRERSADLKDVKGRIQRVYLGVKETSLSTLREPVIIAAVDLYPSDTVRMKKEHVLGIVTQVGGFTSHSAILSRSYGIPAIVGVKNLTDKLCDGETVVLDAENGLLFTNPSEAEIAHYQTLRCNFLAERKKLDAYKRIVPVTQDGVRIEVDLNIGGDGMELTELPFADGVGLFRTEFLFMRKADPPDEDEQEAAYRAVLTAAAGKPVYIRTLDIGGDKALFRLDDTPEPNPFLGLRAVRYCFQHEDLFLCQLRALLRAATAGSLGILFPMISSIEELRACRVFLGRAKEQLRERGVPFGEDVGFGCVIEVPSMALLADTVADEVDFASIGTNDLCQYTLAVDRLNSRVGSYYQSFHPALLKAVKMTADAFAEKGKPLGVCGELAGDTAGALVLLGLGVKKLSMNAGGVSAIKKLITNTTFEKAKAIADQALTLSSAAEIEQYLREALKGLY